MHRGFFALVLLALVVPACAQTPEHRGLWVGNFSYDTPAEAEAVVARAAAANLNVLYPLVWYNGGQAWYNSNISPKAATVAPNYDPLGYLIKIAHARGMDVHAWFVSGSYGDPKNGVVFKEHPDWALQSAQGPAMWYDLAKPEVRKFETDVMIDCLKNYDVDGLHFDYIRYDGQEYCYCNHCQTEFSARYGFSLLSPAGGLPASISSNGNPLAEVTTARVLATFDDGQPAITLNSLGQGEAALVNWTAQRGSVPGVDDFVKRMLVRFGASKDNLFVLGTNETRARYGAESQGQAREWLRRLGYESKLVDETQVGQLPAGGTVILPAQYYIPEETAAWLRQFVTAGGHCLFIDGPVFAIKYPDLQHVIGLKGSGKYFLALRLVSPAPGQDLIPSGPALDLEKERQRAAKWIEYRKATVTDLVRSVREAALKVKPQAKLSAAVFETKASADAVCQDWYAWLDAGLLDYVIPMAYVMPNPALEGMLQEYKAFDPKMERIIPGLSVYQRGTAGDSSRPPELVLSQEALCRSYGANGVAYFSYNEFSEAIAAALGAGPYRQPVAAYYPKLKR
ncbi:MAG: family 10 glycosylhydrolase [Armatimonadia bacterium]